MMKMIYKSIIFIMLFGVVANAEIVAGIAVRVNDKAITIQEIKNTMKNAKVAKQEAIDLLIEDRLKRDEIEKMGIVVDDFRIDEEIQRIAQNNGLSKDQLISSVAKEGLSYSKYREELKKQIEHTEFIQRVLSQSVGIVDQKELRNYYQKNQKEFVVPTKVLVTRYLSNNQLLLQEIQKKPNALINGVEKLNETIILAELNPQVAQVFLATKIGGFTPILNSGANAFITFLVKSHSEPKQLSFEESRPSIQQKIMVSKEKTLIKEHFAKLKNQAKIVYIR